MGVSVVAWLVICRAVHFAAALVAFGTLAFEALVVAPCERREGGGIAAVWRPVARRLVAGAFFVLVLSGVGWFIFAAADMTGSGLREPFAGGKVQLVWSRTHFGFVWQVRAVLCAGAVVACVPALMMELHGAMRGRFLGLAAFLTGGLLASLAWAGHAGSSGPLTVRVGMDALHLLIAGLWPAGLLPLAWLLARVRRAGMGSASPMVFLIMRYSNVSLAGVALLLATGVGQIWLIPHAAGMVFTTYGMLLGAKVMVFGVLVGVGGFNRYRHVPALVRKDGDEEAGQNSLRRLFWNVVAELMMAVGIVGIVAVLGITAPGSR